MIVLKILGGFALIVLIIAGLSLVVKYVDDIIQEILDEEYNKKQQQK